MVPDVRWASAVPENMQKKWRKNFAEEGFRRQQFTATQTVHFPWTDRKQLRNWKAEKSE